MAQFDGLFTQTDILIVGAGAGGLLAALSAKRNGARGTRVTLVDSWMIGRTGHTAFSNAWKIVVFPDDDLDGICAKSSPATTASPTKYWCGNRSPLRTTACAISRRLAWYFPAMTTAATRGGPTRGLDLARVMHPEGGGLEFCWRLRRALEREGVQLIDRLFVTGLLRGDDGRIVGAAGINSRTGQFHVISAKATIVATNAITFRSGFVRDITGTGTLLAYRAGATLRNAEFSYVRPGTPKFYFEGITFAIQEGAQFVNDKGEAFMRRHEPVWGDEADVPRIARAMALEKKAGNEPLYLDMSGVPAEMRNDFIQSKVKWMDCFFRKLGSEASTDMFGKTPYYALNQMTKMGIRTAPDCRSDIPGLLAAGLAQGGCANHFAGFHIGLCIGNGWIAGRSAVEDMDSASAPGVDPKTVQMLHDETLRPLSDGAEAELDRILRDLQQIMFAYDVGILKRADRLELALEKILMLAARTEEIAAPHVHELVRLKETEAMLLAARLILGASLYRTESRLSHFREDHEQRDDGNWLCWVDLTERGSTPAFRKTPVPTPYCSANAIPAGGPSRLRKRFATTGV